MREVHRKIISYLLSNNVKKVEIMRFCGCGLKTLLAWERGWWNPKPENLHRLRVLYIKVRSEHENQMEFNYGESTI